MGLLEEEEDVDFNQTSRRISEMTVNLTSCDYFCGHAHYRNIWHGTNGTKVNWSCEIIVRFGRDNSAVSISYIQHIIKTKIIKKKKQ